MGIAEKIFGPAGGRDHTEASSVLRAEASDNASFAGATE